MMIYCRYILCDEEKGFMNQREKIERVKEFRLIDDVFFEVFASDIPACQEILRVIPKQRKKSVWSVGKT